MIAIGLNFQLQSNAGAPRLARDALRPLHDELGPEILTALRMVISELVANAVHFGPGGPISISLEIDSDGSVRGAVDDGGRAGVRMVEPDPLQGTGFGLQIVAALTRAWGVDPDSTRVWFELETA
jgi:two-component sensor histidine kinase